MKIQKYYRQNVVKASKVEELVLQKNGPSDKYDIIYHSMGLLIMMQQCVSNILLLKLLEVEPVVTTVYITVVQWYPTDRLGPFKGKN